jgi:hypothetical protein
MLRRRVGMVVRPGSSDSTSDADSAERPRTSAVAVETEWLTELIARF